MDPALQVVLAPDAEALLDDLVGLHRRVAVGDEAVGDDPVGLQERAQHAVGEPAADVDQRVLVTQLVAELALAGEEELELQEVAQSERVLQRVLHVVGPAAARARRSRG